MAKNCLEFEKPIAELENKLAEWKKFSSANDIDVSDEMRSLQDKIKDLMKKTYKDLTPWQRVQLARHPQRPYTLDYVERIFTDFMELHGDRRYSDDAAIIGGFAKLDGQKVMVIGTQKGHDMKENVFRNFGLPQPEGYRKAIRLMELANKAGIPIITFVDTPGAFPGVESEERHIAEAIAVNLRDMFSLKVPVISIIIGEGGSGGAIGIGVGNRILIMENAYYSVITPEGCAAILWKDRKYSEKAADALSLTAAKLHELGIADEVIPEPLGGAHKDYDSAAEKIKKCLLSNLKGLCKMKPEELKDQRFEKFRQMGEFIEETQEK
jgi:acetyl-CoA carboxylase carboxyl transferase subunit alpha